MVKTSRLKYNPSGLYEEMCEVYSFHEMKKKIVQEFYYIRYIINYYFENLIRRVKIKRGVLSMAFSIIFFIAWLSITAFYAMKKQYSKLENSALFFCILIVNINYSWIIYDELNLITYSKIPLYYTAYVIFRSIIIPTLILLGINCIPRNSTILKKMIGILISSFVLTLIKFILLKLDVVNFHKWNMFLDYLYFILLNSFGLFILYCYRSFILKEVKM